jgi:hypothetical protein
MDQISHTLHEPPSLLIAPGFRTIQFLFIVRNVIPSIWSICYAVVDSEALKHNSNGAWSASNSAPRSAVRFSCLAGELLSAGAHVPSGTAKHGRFDLLTLLFIIKSSALWHVQKIEHKEFPLNSFRNGRMGTLSFPRIFYFIIQESILCPRRIYFSDVNSQ